MLTDETYKLMVFLITVFNINNTFLSPTLWAILNSSIQSMKTLKPDYYKQENV